MLADLNNEMIAVIAKPAAEPVTDAAAFNRPGHLGACQEDDLLAKPKNANCSAWSGNSRLGTGHWSPRSG